MTAQYLRTQAKRAARAYTPPTADGVRRPSPDKTLAVLTRGPVATPAQTAVVARLIATQPDSHLLADMLGITQGDQPCPPSR